MSYVADRTERGHHTPFVGTATEPPTGGKPRAEAKEVPRGLGIAEAEMRPFEAKFLATCATANDVVRGLTKRTAV